MYNEFNYNVFAIRKGDSLCVFFLLLAKKKGLYHEKSC